MCLDLKYPDSPCLFCQLIDGQKQSLLPEDLIVDISSNFYLKPALGQFIEGYCLLVSKMHVQSMALLPDLNLFNELNTFKNSIIKKLTELYGNNIIVFEHGIVDQRYYAGCC